MARPAIVVALPPGESPTVCASLMAAGFEVIPVDYARELEFAMDARRDIGRAVMDGEIDADEASAFETALRGTGRPIPTLTVVSPRVYERLTGADMSDGDDEYFTRPYSADSIR